LRALHEFRGARASLVALSVEREATMSVLAIATRARAPVVAAMAVMLLGGCPGQLEDPDRFRGGEVSCDELDVERDLLASGCGGAACHGPENANLPADLDLESPGVAERVVGVVSECDERILADPEDPAGSYLLEKLYPAPSCGAQMPLGRPALSESEIGCIQDWIVTLELAAADGAP
jgi:hypothetical protein